MCGREEQRCCRISQERQLGQLMHGGSSRIHLEFIWGGEYILLFKNQSKQNEQTHELLVMKRKALCLCRGEKLRQRKIKLLSHKT